MLAKKGRRYGSRVRRYMRLKGSVLSNHRAKDEPATWSVSLQEATVSGNPRKKKIVLELYDIALELYTETRDDCSKWLEALGAACRGQVVETLKQTDSDKLNSSRPGSHRQVTIAQEHNTSQEQSKAKDRLISALNRSFKVVKPQTTVADEDEDDDNEAYEGAFPDAEQRGPQPQNAAGAIYEESPTSIIFKQFKFPNK